MNKLIFISLLASSSCFAEVSTQLRESSSSMGIGLHSQGMMINYMYTGDSGYGIFLGGASVGFNNEDTSTEANYSWVDYSNKVCDSREAYHFGLAYQLNEYIKVGIGYGKKTTVYSYSGYWLGFSLRSGATEKISLSGAVGIVEVAAPKGFGLQILTGVNAVGAGLVVPLDF